MKRKPHVGEESVVDQELLEKARTAALQTDQVKRLAKCSVCGAECAPNSAEPLCWVCRRLKISAWRESDSQLNAQE
jgi:hypothetical protein